MNFFIQTLQTDPFRYLTTVVIVMFSICVHECAHAWVALREGDDTPAWLGHISLNPRVQMGWQSIVILLLFGIAWGAVPYNARNFRNPWSGALMAFAGPLANLILSFLFAAGIAIALHFHPVGDTDPGPALQFFALASSLNAMLFVFNMMPLPILDGWKVLSLFIPDMTRIPPQHASSISWIGMILLWSRGSALLWGASDFISRSFFRIWHVVI
jgi:Zn-dependent protease